MKALLPAATAASRSRCSCSLGSASEAALALSSSSFFARQPLQGVGPCGAVQCVVSSVAGRQSVAPPEHPGLGGHTARRSGAKRLARLGWRVLVIQPLVGHTEGVPDAVAHRLSDLRDIVTGWL